MFTAAMLEEPNNKPYLHKNKIYFPKENHSIVSLLQHGRREHTLFFRVSWESKSQDTCKTHSGSSLNCCTLIIVCKNSSLRLEQEPILKER